MKKKERKTPTIDIQDLNNNQRCEDLLLVVQRKYVNPVKSLVSIDRQIIVIPTYVKLVN